MTILVNWRLVMIATVSRITGAMPMIKGTVGLLVPTAELLHSLLSQMALLGDGVTVAKDTVAVGMAVAVGVVVGTDKGAVGSSGVSSVA